MKKRNILWRVCILILLLALLQILHPLSPTINLSTLPLDTVNKLMIIAHPDDDLIWGGSHLIDDQYLVVCLTCGVDTVRVKEFEQMMEKTKDPYIMLGYPDKTRGKVDRWKKEKKTIEKQLDQIIGYKKWEVIVTHNPEGEYGHIQHRMTSNIVTSLSPKENLWYFGKYYKPSDLPTDMPVIKSENQVIKLDDLVPLYTSQQIVKPYGHMLSHENWIRYEEWK